VLLPTHLESMSRAIDEYAGYDIYSCNGYFWFADGSRELFHGGEEASLQSSWSLEQLFRACFFSVGACYRRSLFDEVGGYLEDVYGEDYDFWLRAMAGGATHCYVPQALALHRKTPSQKSADLKRAYSSDIRSIASVLTAHSLSPAQVRAAKSAIRHRKRMLFELTPVGGTIIGALRLARSILTGGKPA
jgi:GT2 family glycosyltransferase